MKKILASFIALSIVNFGSTPLLAKECKAKTLRKKGHVRENASGYMDALDTDKKTLKCVEKINEKRRKKYAEIADKSKVDLALVEAEAAKKLQSK